MFDFITRWFVHISASEARAKSSKFPKDQSKAKADEVLCRIYSQIQAVTDHSATQHVEVEIKDYWNIPWAWSDLHLCLIRASAHDSLFENLVMSQLSKDGYTVSRKVKLKTINPHLADGQSRTVDEDLSPESYKQSVDDGAKHGHTTRDCILRVSW